MREIINEYLVTFLREQKDLTVHNAFVEGLTIINSDIALFFTCEMIQSSKKMLVSLIEEYSKQRAYYIVEKQNAKASVTTGDKKAKYRMDGIKDDTTSDSTDILPLRDVIKCIAEHFPELFEIQLQYEHSRGHIISSSDSRYELTWETDQSNSIGMDGPLIEFCRNALFSDELQCMCTHAIKAEVSRLHSTRHGVSVSTNTEGAAKIQNMEEAFESSFRDMCSLLQVLSKSLETIGERAQRYTAVAKSEEGQNTDIDMMLGRMKQELLQGCGSCLAMHITKYCLFKNVVDMQGEGYNLGFDSEPAVVPEIGLDTSNFCHPINVAVLSFPCISLRYKPDACGKSPNPLMFLKSLLPGSVGLGLSRMWDLCSVTDKNYENDGPGSGLDGQKLDQFLRHLEESCLTLIGIPFSKLDKKTEKKVMAARREGILRILENSQAKEEILTSAIVLIYQLVKNVAIAGSTTINLVLNLFECEKKIPSLVTDTLLKLRTEENVSSNMLDQVKQFGSAKSSKALAAIVDGPE